VQLKDRRLGALLVSVALAGCRNAPLADGPAQQRGAPVPKVAAAAPTPHQPSRAARGVASTDAALLVDDADRWR
jgi:hypothetical protein